MMDVLLGFPVILGCFVFTGLTSAVGLAVYAVTFRHYDRRQTEAAMKEIEDITGNLLRVVGWLFTLLLSLTFTNVVGERTAAKNAVESEVRALADVHQGMERFGLEETRGLNAILLDYTQAVIDDDWPALGAHGRLSERTAALLRRLQDGVLNLEATNARQRSILPLLVADVDLISDLRLARLQQAGELPTLSLSVVFFGYLISMVYFGVYRPRPIVVGLVSLYTMLVGLALYLILVASDPFTGSTAIATTPLESLVEELRADMADPGR